MPTGPDFPLKLGTRGSPLALAQAEEARNRLCAAHGWSRDAVQLIPITASGDRVQDRPLAEIGGKALWTKELDACLHDGRIDFAVHSMKDVETFRPPQLTIAAVLPREDVSDALVGAVSLAAIPPGARAGTDAPRRAAQLRHARPDLSVLSFRGNVATRLARLAAGEADVTFLAQAGLNRLGETGVGTVLDTNTWLPAPAQGAIGIECLTGREDLRRLLSAIDHAASRAEVLAERALLAALGGSCRSAIAALTTRDKGALVLRARLFSPDGAEMVEDRESFAEQDSAGPTRLAARLLAAAPAAITDHFRPR